MVSFYYYQTPFLAKQKTNYKLLLHMNISENLRTPEHTQPHSTKCLRESNAKTKMIKPFIQLTTGKSEVDLSFCFVIVHFSFF